MDNLLNRYSPCCRLITEPGPSMSATCRKILSMINDTPMQAASLIKLYIMGAVYENYDTLSQSHNGDEIDSNISAMINCQ